jgi:putative molybdopterin biosynthesis protein
VKQHQFLDVVDEATAHDRFDELCKTLKARVIKHPLNNSLLGHTLAEDVRAPVDVPGFDRSNVDGFAVKARNTYGAVELEPISLKILLPGIAAGDNPRGREVTPGAAIPIATGAVIPRGSDAVVMVEDTTIDDERPDLVHISRASAPGDRVAWAGTDLGRGEVVLYRGQELSSRETGLLAAIGIAEVKIIEPAHVAIASTGDEIIPPGAPLSVGQIYDSNSRIVSDAVREAGGRGTFLGIIPDDEALLEERLEAALTDTDDPIDILILSGGTSKGAGDLNARVVEKLASKLPNSAGIIVHGVALKPGKPLCLAGIAGKAVAILPGFPSSAIFTFHEFLAPLVRKLSGRPERDSQLVLDAVTPLKTPSVVGRTQYTLVNLVRGPRGLSAYPLGSGSGSVSTFSRADGFLRIDQHTEYLAAGSQVKVRLLSAKVRPSDLVAIGSHCVGLDYLLGAVAQQGFRTKSIVVGSTAGLNALKRGEGDIAGTHLFDETSQSYNRSFIPPACRLLKGYRRRQGLVFRVGDRRFEGRSKEQILAVVKDPRVRMVNRNRGSGTRILIDQFTGPLGREFEGYQTQARSHHAVAASVAQGRADWGITLDTLARQNDLGFLFLQDEHYDFAIPEDRWDQAAVVALRTLLTDEQCWLALNKLGFHKTEESTQ